LALVQECFYSYIQPYPFLDAILHISSILLIASALRHCYSKQNTILLFISIFLLTVYCKLAINYQYHDCDLIYLVYFILYILLCLGFMLKSKKIYETRKIAVVMYALLSLLLPLILFISSRFLHDAYWHRVNLQVSYISHICFIVGFTSMLLYLKFKIKKIHV